MRQPECQNCEKRGLECSFLLLAPSSRLSAASVTPSPVSTTSQATSNEYEICRRDSSSSNSSTSLSWTPPHGSPANIISKPSLLPRSVWLVDVWNESKELEPYYQYLFNHYADSTCLTLATDEPGKASWQSVVPGIAFEHKFLVHGVLSIASLHLARLYEGKEQRDKMNRIAADQMNRALSYFRVELENINEKNAAALFAHSTLTALYFFRTSTLDMEQLRESVPTGSEPSPDITEKMMFSFTRTLWGLRGALSVLTPGWNWVIDGELSPVCARRWWPKHRVPQTMRAKEEDRRLAELENLWTNPVRSESKCLSDSLMHLRETYALVSLLTDPENKFPPINSPIPYSVDDTTVGMLRDRAAIFVWATKISKEFISLVEQRDRDALVIIAHYAVLLGRVRSVWWLQGLGSHAIWAVAIAIGRKHQHLIEWPVQAVGVDLSGDSGCIRKADT